MTAPVGNGEATEESAVLSQDLVLERLFEAPRELVFKAFTEPERLAQWWGPRGFTNPVCELDLRVGGRLRIVMRDWNGADYPMTGVFREIDPPALLMFTTAALDGDGNEILQGQWAVTLSEEGSRTRLTLRASAGGRAEIVKQMLAGFELGTSQSLEKLAESLAGA